MSDITQAQKDCGFSEDGHEWQQFSIAMIGLRWQCVRCDLIAPPCFVPIQKKTAAEQFLDDHIVIVRVP